MADQRVCTLHVKDAMVYRLPFGPIQPHGWLSQTSKDIVKDHRFANLELSSLRRLLFTLLLLRAGSLRQLTLRLALIKPIEAQDVFQ